MKMKVTFLSLAALAVLARGAPLPEADPEAFFPLGAIALPAITNSALIDGLLLGKLAFLKAAIVANLLLGSSDESADELAGEYGAPVDSYGAPAVEYAEPAPIYDAPAPIYEEPAPIYDAPAPAYSEPIQVYEEPVDTYGAPVAAPIDSYGTPAYYKF